MYKFDTLVLSGGAVKGVAFLGGIQYLQEKNLLDLDYFVGTSIGTVINYLLIIGYSPLDIAHIVCTSSVFKVIHKMNWISMINNEGALSFEPIYEELEVLSLQKLNTIPTLQELYDKTQKKFVLCTFNATRRQLEYIDHTTDPDLNCLEAIRLSSNLPLVFPTVLKDGDKYIDGGIIMNFPLQYGVEHCGEHVLGMILNNGIEYDDRVDSVVMDLMQMVHIPINYISEDQIDKYKDNPNVTVIRLPQKRPALDFQMNVTQVLNMFSNGYNKVKNDLEKHNL